jgi:hypothetical protein
MASGWLDAVILSRAKHRREAAKDAPPPFEAVAWQRHLRMTAHRPAFFIPLLPRWAI